MELEDIAVDSQFAGVVKAVSNFGAFIDFGAVSDGLVHKSQLADAFVEDPNDIVQVGDNVNVRVIKVDPDNGRVSLSMKSKRERNPRGERRERSNMQDLSK